MPHYQVYFHYTPLRSSSSRSLLLLPHPLFPLLPIPLLQRSHVGFAHVRIARKELVQIVGGNDGGELYFLGLVFVAIGSTDEEGGDGICGCRRLDWDVCQLGTGGALGGDSYEASGSGTPSSCSCWSRMIAAR
jgi:hypothetical protein